MKSLGVALSPEAFLLKLRPWAASIVIFLFASKPTPLKVRTGIIGNAPRPFARPSFKFNSKNVRNHATHESLQPL